MYTMWVPRRSYLNPSRMLHVYPWQSPNLALRALHILEEPKIIPGAFSTVPE